ncbi:MAG: PTS sugar transporter subunit IIA [Treponema sp.]
MDADIAELIKKGGVYQNVEGVSPEQVYKNISGLIKLPQSLSPDMVYEALCSREKLMSTAVGNGIALPHARNPILKSEDEERIAVVYLKNPLDMGAPDGCKVFVMFVLFAETSQSHLFMLASLVEIFKKPQFKKLLEARAGEDELLEEIGTCA